MTGAVKFWYTTAELAALSLPGLSSVQRAVNRFADEQRWAEKFAGEEPLARKRPGRGGPIEYHYSVLPAPAALELVKMGLISAAETALNDVSEPVEAPVTASWAWFDAQPEKVKAEARRRLTILQAVDATVSTGLGVNTAVSRVAADSGVSAATIWNWRKLVTGVAQGDYLPAVAPRRKGGGAKAEYDERIYETFKSYFLTPTARTYAGAYFYTRRVPELAALDFPDVKTLQRRLEREVPREVIILKRQGVKALMESIPAQTRTVAGMAAMDLVNIDGHKFDVFVIPPDGGKPIRPILIGMQDVFSRKMLAWRLCGEESIFHTRLCFADLFARWGLPKGVLMDNGRAFASKYLTGGTKTRFRYVIRETDPFGLLPSLGIKNHFATPEHGQAKPIERGFGDLVKFVAQHPDCEGAYTGNRPDRKPHNYGSKALEWDSFSQLVDEMIGEYNAYQDRRTEMAQGRSFDQVFFESYQAQAITKATPQQLRMALLEAKSHRCDAKTGEIRMFGNRYFAQPLYELAGQDVTIRFDPDHLHTPIHVYSLTGRFVCEAQPIDAVGFLDAEAAKATARKRSDVRKLARQLLDAENLLTAAQMKALQPHEPGEDDAPSPRPAALRLVRTRGNSAAAERLVVDGAPKAERAPVIDRFNAVVQRQAQPAQRKFAILDGGLAPNGEPERPN